MAGTSEKVIFSFSEYGKDIVSTRAISYAHDNRFLVCCSESILVFTISCDIDPHRGHQFRDLPFNLHVQQIVDLHKLPALVISDGVLDTAKTFPQISLQERHELVMDSSLSALPTFLTMDVNAFRRAVFSPCSSLCNHSHVIAALTSNHRVFIFEEHSNVWSLFSELTEAIKKYVTSSLDLPVAVGKNDMSFMQYKDMVHGMCCVDLVWSSAFQDNLDTDKFKNGTHLLFCGMKNGDVQIWKMKTSPRSYLGGLSFHFTSKCQYSSQVTSLCWNLVEPKVGHLAVGHMDGCIQIIKVIQTLNTDEEFKAEKMFEHSPCDSLSVFDLAFTQLDNNAIILVACKQFYVGIYSIKDNAVKHVKSNHLDCSLPLISISLHRGYGTVACQDGSIFHLNFSTKTDDIIVDYKRSKVMCLPHISQVMWSCKGLVLSVNGAFCLSVHSPLTDYPVKFGGRLATAERQKVVLSLTHCFSEDSYIFSPTPSCPVLYESPVDITVRLLLILKSYFNSNQSLDLIEQVLSKLVVSARIENLQVARALYIFEVFKIQHSPLQDQKLSFSDENKIKDLTEKILITHASNCLTWALRNNKDISKLPSMLHWATGNEGRHQAILNQLNMEDSFHFVQTESVKSHCVLCEAKLERFQNHLDVECVNGHPNQLCCLTFKPLEGLDTRHCLSCQTGASGAKKIQEIDVPYIRKNKDICVVCGGKLSQ